MLSGDGEAGERPIEASKTAPADDLHASARELAGEPPRVADIVRSVGQL